MYYLRKAMSEEASSNVFLMPIKCHEQFKPRMYFDDTHLTYASNKLEDMNGNLSQDLAHVTEWLIAN